MQKEAFQEIVRRGVAQVEEAHRFLSKAFIRVLEALGEHQAAATLQALEAGEAACLEDPASIQVVSYYFQLLNLAEQHVAETFAREREALLGPLAEAGSWAHYFSRLREAEAQPEALRRHMGRCVVEPVFTKHPTEAKRWNILGIHRDLAGVLESLDGAETAFQRTRCIEEVSTILERLWLSGELFERKPRVEDERENLEYYLGEILPSVFDRLDARLRQAWEAVWPEAPPLSHAEMPVLRFGSWVGGDRDGHPLVTAEVTRETLRIMREAGCRVIRSRLASLARKLSFTGRQTPTPEGMKAQLEAWRVPDPDREPWRQYVNGLAERLEEIGSAGVREHLETLGEWLDAAGARLTRLTRLDPVIRYLRGNGLAAARIDIRQNSAYYETALCQTLQAAGMPEASAYPDWPEDQRRAFLRAELTHPRPLTHPTMELPPQAHEVRETFTVLAQHLKERGSEGLGVLVVSMCRELSDLLVVYLLGKETGLTVQSGGPDGGMRCRLPVVPLFETHEDLRRAPDITRSFLAEPCTRASLQAEDGMTPDFMVMLGYSDSNKDTGIIASQWGLQEAQRDIGAAARDSGTGVLFFHGRGGTVGRGAGPTHRFLESLPPGSLQSGLRITEQGEVIAQKYNTPGTAAANLEWLVAGTVGAHFLGGYSPSPERLEPLMDALARSSRRAYRELLEAPGFMAFFREATPIDGIEQSRIGSRPARRTGQSTLEDLRAIPWVFSWNQARFYLPGWYGVGSALETLRGTRPEDHQFLKAHVASHPFLRYLFFNIESSLASSSLKWMEAYAGLVTNTEIRERIFQQVRTEHHRTGAELDQLFASAITDRRPRFWKTLQDRQGGLALLHERQIRLLREFRQQEEPGDGLREALLLVINAIASGLRTTG